MHDQFLENEKVSPCYEVLMKTLMKNLSNKKSTIYRNLLQSPHNINGILNTLKPLLRHLYEKVYNEKIIMKKHRKIYRFRGRLEENTYNETKKAHSLCKKFIFFYSKSIKVYWATHLSFTRN